MLPLHFVFVIPLLLCGTLLTAQENCDNGIDDDGDGLVDLNDTADCTCSFASSVPSLLPNPSLEEFAAEQEGCESIQPGGLPDAPNQANCLVGWQRASIGTTDAWNAFTLSGAPPFFPGQLPQPLPSGTGVAGFWVGVQDAEDTEFLNQDGTTTRQYREYLAACLDGGQRIDAGSDYRLTFSLGFMLPQSFENQQGMRVDMGSPAPIELNIYGIRSCDQLYFGDYFNCPEQAGAEGYELIQSVQVQGTAGAWTPVALDFTARGDYAAFAIGGSCAGDIGRSDSEFFRNYYFIDDVILNRPEAFNQPVAGPVSVTGQTICADAITLTGQTTTGATYQWYKGGVALVGETTNRLTLRPSLTIDGVYVLRITTAGGCAITEEVVIQRPILADLVPDSVALCPQVDTLFLQPARASGATFNWSDGSDLPYLLLTEPGDYSVTVSTVCEQRIETFTALETENITASIRVDPLVYCLGDTISATVASNYYYNGVIYSTPDGQSVIFSATGEAEFVVADYDTLLVTIFHGCGQLIDTLVLTADAEFEVAALITDLSCETPVGSIDLTVDNADRVEFFWTDPLGNPVGDSAPRLQVTVPGTYRVDLVDGVRCPTSYSYPVVYTDDFRLNLTLDSISCGDDGAAGVLPTGGSAPYAVDWYRGESALPFATNTTQVDALSAGDYRVAVTDSTGCERTEVFALFQLDTLSISATTSFADCTVEGTGIVTVLASGGVPPYTFRLNEDSPSNTGVFSELTAGTYTVEVRDSRGCDPVTTEVEVVLPTLFTLELPERVVLNLGDSILLELGVLGIPAELGRAVWTPSDSLSYPLGEGSVTVRASPTQTTRYQVTYTSNEGCGQTDEILVIVDEALRVYVPSAFSPNGDGTNDEFLVYPGPAVQSIRSVRVHDRWGGLVYERSGEEPGWDGRLGGKPLNSGVYFYLVEGQLVNGRLFTTSGSVNLVR